MKLQAHKRKYKNRFNTNVHTISDKLLDLDERVSDVNAQYTMLLDQVEHATHVDIPDLQAQVEALQNQAEAVPALRAMSSESLLHERTDVKASIQTLRELVDGKSAVNAYDWHLELT
jgi:chromosome segregation ATPase